MSFALSSHEDRNDVLGEDMAKLDAQLVLAIGLAHAEDGLLSLRSSDSLSFSSENGARAIRVLSTSSPLQPQSHPFVASVTNV